MLLNLAEHSSLLYFSFDLNTGQFAYQNPAFQAFFGAEQGNIELPALLTMMHPDDRGYMEEQLRACLTQKAPTEAECRFVRGGHERSLRIYPYLHTDLNRRWLMGHAEDITAYKTHSDLLHEHNNRKNSILNILTHDLAGPIGNIQNFADLLVRESGARSENTRAISYISSIKNISKNCISLIRDFISQEFLESAGLRLKKRRVELVGRIKSVTQEYLTAQADLGISFFCTSGKDIIYVAIDEDKFLQALNNLISNSLKFTPAGGKISINIEESDQHVLITVADTGIGIPAEHHATLFEKFSDARRTGLQGEVSTGLGMSIIKTIVEWHQGKIWFKSEVNEGTTFYVQLPK